MAEKIKDKVDWSMIEGERRLMEKYQWTDGRPGFSYEEFNGLVSESKEAAELYGKYKMKYGSEKVARHGVPTFSHYFMYAVLNMSQALQKIILKGNGLTYTLADLKFESSGRLFEDAKTRYKADYLGYLKFCARNELSHADVDNFLKHIIKEFNGYGVGFKLTDIKLEVKKVGTHDFEYKIDFPIKLAVPI